VLTGTAGLVGSLTVKMVAATGTGICATGKVDKVTEVGYTPLRPTYCRLLYNLGEPELTVLDKDARKYGEGKKGPARNMHRKDVANVRSMLSRPQLCEERQIGKASTDQSSGENTFLDRDPDI
jgi:hypothetical protein